MRDLFKNKNFALLFSGSLVSELGNVLFAFAGGLYVADLTNSPIMLGVVMAVGAFARLVASPVAGVLVDRWNRVRIIYLTDFFRGVMYIGIAYLFYMQLTQQEATITILVVTTVSGIVSALFGPAVTSALPDIVGIDKLQQANGANSIIQSSTQIAGVLLGILAVSLFEFHVALLINGVSFMISGFSEMFIRETHKGEYTPEPAAFRDDMKIGFRYMLQREGLLTMMIFSLFLNFAFVPLFSVGIPSLLRIQLERGAWEIGWANIAFSIAMMIGGIVIGSMKFKSITKPIRRSLLLLVSSFISVTLIIYLLDIGVISYWVFYTLFIISNVLMAFFMMATNVPLQTGMIKVIDPEVRGRVMSTVQAISGGAIPFAMVLGGVLIENTSVAFLGLVCSVLLLLPTFGFMTNKKVENLLDGISEENNGRVQEAV